MKRIIIATGNAHKVEEFEALLGSDSFIVESAKVCGGMPDVDETGTTFEANAQLKAEALRVNAPHDAWVLADDSGLEVDVLNGAPGIYSARYAGSNATDGENLTKLLKALESVPEDARSGRFRCALCLVGPSGLVEFFEGKCEGRIDFTPHGKSGFGYDPVFIPEGYDKSFAELGESVKSELSHRARAVLALKDAL